jgi:heme exporter protein B
LKSNSEFAAWQREILAVIRKEWQSELRAKTGFATAGLFAFVTVVTTSLAFFNRNVNNEGLPQVASSLLWTIVLFSSLLSLPRAFVLEEETGTLDLLRLTARPHSIFWGKALFNLGQTLGIAVAASLLFIAFTGTHVPRPDLFAGALLGGTASISAAVTLCSAIAAQAANRGTLAAAIAVPLLLPILQMGVSAMRAAFGAGLISGGVTSVIGLIGYAIATMAVSPYIYAAIWKS